MMKCFVFCFCGVFVLGACSSTPVSGTKRKLASVEATTESEEEDQWPSGVAAGFRHSCLVKDGQVKCWGRFDPLRAKLVGVWDATAVAIGEHHACGVKEGTSVFCWGMSKTSNQYGQLGNGSVRGNGAVPTEVKGLPNGIEVLDIAAGQNHTCVLARFTKDLRSSKSVWCWGANGLGQLGIGSKDPVSTIAKPVVLQEGGGPLMGDFVGVAAGVYHTCVATQESVYCWGSNGCGQLGHSSLRVNMHQSGHCFSSRPMEQNHVRAAVQGDKTFGVLTGIAAGLNHTCVADAASSVWCWGGNWASEIGVNTSIKRYSAVPVAVLQTNGIVSLSSTYQFTCGLNTDQDVLCWGNGPRGRLDGKSNGVYPVPVPVDDIPGAVVSMASGGAHNCALLSDGDVVCWGGGYQRPERLESL